MTENTEPTTGGAQGAPAAPKKDLVAEYRKMPAAEKMLACAAVVVLVTWIIERGYDLFFKLVWFPTCAIVGAALILVAIVLDMFGVKFIEAKARTWLMVLLSILPAVGFVIDTLDRSFWYALMLAGSIVMGFAGVKITRREQIIKT